MEFLTDESSVSGHFVVEPLMSPAPLRIATRASQLALWQSNYIADLLRQAAPGREVVLVEISTTGDRVQTETLRWGVSAFSRGKCRRPFSTAGPIWRSIV